MHGLDRFHGNGPYGKIPTKEEPIRMLGFTLPYNKYLLLTEFEGHTVSYGPSFSYLIYGPSAKRVGHKLKGKKRGSVTYSTERENEVSKIFILSLVCVWGAQEQFLFTRNGFKFLTYLESKTSQFKIVFKSLARFSTPFRVKKKF